MHVLSQKTLVMFERRLSELGMELERVLRARADGAAWKRRDEHEVSSLTRARLASELRHIESALARIAEGRFGMCGRCGLPIAKNRLLADPTASYCERCSEDGVFANDRPDDGASERAIGERVQAYARSKWRAETSREKLSRLGEHLEQELRERVDALGFEGERLLDVPPGAVLDALAELERQAEEEDARARQTADRVRAEEEHAFEPRVHSEPRKRATRSGRGRKSSTRRRGRPRDGA